MTLTVNNQNTIKETLVHTAIMLTDVISKGTTTKEGVTFNLSELSLLDRTILATYQELQKCQWGKGFNGLTEAAITNLFEIYCNIIDPDFYLLEENCPLKEGRFTLVNDALTEIHDECARIEYTFTLMEDRALEHEFPLAA